METSYLSMVSGSRIKNFLGLTMDAGVDYKHAGVQERNYAYIEIPIRHIENMTTGEIGMKALRNQLIRVVPACTVQVRGNYRFEVHPDRSLWAYGVVEGMFYLEPQEGEMEPSFYMHLRKDMELSKDSPVIRIYMRS